MYHIFIICLVFYSLLIQSFNFIVCDCFCKSHSVIITIEHGIELSHKYITYEEHVFLDVHCHDWWCACFVSSALWVFWNLMMSMTFSVSLNLEIFLEHRRIIPDLVTGSDLYHELWSNWTHTEMHLGTSLSQVWRLSWEHPLLIGLQVVFTSNNESHITEVFLTIAFHNVVWCWNSMFSEVGSCPLWNWHKRSSRIESDQAFFTSANTFRLSIELNIIKLDTIHVFKLYVIPVHFTLVFLFIIIVKSRIWF